MHHFDHEDKVSRLDKWSRIFEDTGKGPSWLTNPPQLPDGAGYLINLRLEILAQCDKLDFQQIASYQSAFGIRLTSFEIRAIMLMDAELNNDNNKNNMLWLPNTPI